MVERISHEWVDEISRDEAAILIDARLSSMVATATIENDQVLVADYVPAPDAKLGYACLLQRIVDAKELQLGFEGRFCVIDRESQEIKECLPIKYQLCPDQPPLCEVAEENLREVAHVLLNYSPDHELDPDIQHALANGVWDGAIPAQPDAEPFPVDQLIAKRLMTELNDHLKLDSFTSGCADKSFFVDISQVGLDPAEGDPDLILEYFDTHNYVRGIFDVYLTDHAATADSLAKYGIPLDHAERIRLGFAQKRLQPVTKEMFEQVFDIVFGPDEP